MIRFVLMDIEGTTTAIVFVHEVLFPYAEAHLAAFVRQDAADPAVQSELAAVKQTVFEENQKEITAEEAIQQLLDWIKTDRKHPALKTLQGYLWKTGYQTGEYKGHIYHDVRPALEKWRSAGIKMGVYSSGSVEAQQLLFGYSDKGDLRPYFSAWFDTKIGPKRAVQSYLNIREQLGISGEEILFLSDVEQELDAAREAGFHTLQIVRPGTIPGERHPVASDFSEIL